MDIGGWIGAIGGVVGAVGGMLGLVTWVQDQRARARTRAEETQYEQYVGAVHAALASADRTRGTPAIDVDPRARAWAARAVREGQFTWGPDGRTLMLPMGLLLGRSAY